jgi:hypothetical protein
MDQASSTLVKNHLANGASPAGVNHVTNSSPTASLLDSIRQQMEFYFSDQNFPNDVFLNKLLQLDETGAGWISLKVVANFNKIKQLTTQLDVVREALRSSKLIEVSEDGLYIRRRTKILLQEKSPDKRTIYVSKVPKNCDKESLSLVFGEYGAIARLDLPVDKKTGENRGIAFVEYKSEAEMQNALQNFASAKYKMILKPFKAKGELSKQEENKTETEVGKSEVRPKSAKQEKKEKSKKKDSEEHKGKEVIGREVPIIPESMYDGHEAWSGRSRSNSKGARLQTEWDPNPSHANQRPKLHLKGQIESGRAHFVPIRNPLAPDAAGARGFSAGRGKIIVK